MTGVGPKLRSIALLGTLAVALAILVACLWASHSPSLAQASLTPAEVRQILEIASKQRWEMVRFALRKREFKLLRHFVLARTESVHANSGTPEKATLVCRAVFEPGVRVIFNLKREGTNAWRFERWFVTEETRKPAPQAIIPGTPVGETNAIRSVRPDRGQNSLF
jgi:hypothetical protein